MFWIDRDLIFLIFSLILSSSLFLVPEVVFSTFLFINLIYVAINVLLLPLLMFLNFSSSEYDFFIPRFDFFLTWSYLNLIVYNIDIFISTNIFFDVIVTIGDVLIIFEIFLFWIWNLVFLFFPNICDFPLFVVLDVVCNTFTSIHFFVVANDSVPISLLCSLKLSISSAEYILPTLLNFYLNGHFLNLNYYCSYPYWDNKYYSYVF